MEGLDMKHGTEAMGKHFQELRQAKGLSQSELAKAVGVPMPTLRNWEQGRREPGLGAAYHLARALGVSLDELAGDVFKDIPPTRSKKKPARRRKEKGA
jgi:transcriptional regulator with XRE-family HTH domain